MLYLRQTDAVCGSCHGDRPRRSLFRCRVPLRLVANTDPAGKVHLCLPAFLLFMVIFVTSAAAQETTFTQPGIASPPATSTIQVDESQARASIQWLASLALRKMPRTYDGDKDWGETKRLWAGIKIRRDGFKLKTHRRFREVEHGRWVKYEVTLPDPATHRAPIVRIHEVARVADLMTGEERWNVHSSIVTPMTFTARVQRWNLGVKLFSMTITGRMQVRLGTVASIGFKADYGEIPPALVIEPRVEQAQLVLERFEVDRISHIGGDVAEGWGELIQETLVERFVKRQNERIVSKLNRSIEKERDDLRLSMADWLAGWQSGQGK